MVIRYKFIRVDEPTYVQFTQIQKRMETNLTEMTGKKMHIPLTQVCRVVSSPKININIKELLK